ncbi:hypothetical protein VXS06_14860 [Photobacterium toruni]|uniref:DdrB-like domain-containing protein n=1 Tax=Photobacterium toruni TaxID=1935446 RepID=A0ABU6L8Z7_9GAMM|nr:hypothetical protein [Photobacterium toruni]
MSLKLTLNILIQDISTSSSFKELLNIFNSYLKSADINTRKSGLGRVAYVVTAKGQEVATAFKIIDAKNLIPSNTLDGRINPEFPQELQPRDRTRKSSLMQVAKMAGNLSPALLSDSGLSSHGSPIIGRDGVVESGNGRTMAIQKAYVEGKADSYKEYLVNNAPLYGVESDKVKAMQSPVLVRVRLSDVDRAKFARDSNLSDLQSMSAAETAWVDAEVINDKMMQQFNPSDSGNLLAKSNQPFINSFLTEIGDNSTAGLMTADGRPTKQLIDRIQNAIFAKAYKSERLVSLVAEEADPEVRNILNAMNGAASAFVQMQYLDGEAHKQTADSLVSAVDSYSNADEQERNSLADDALNALVGAAELVRQAKTSGQSVDELIAQKDMFATDDIASETLARFIATNNRSSKRLTMAFKMLADSINDELTHQGQAVGDLFGGGEVNLVDILAKVSRDLELELGEGFNQSSLFESLSDRIFYNAKI